MAVGSYEDASGRYRTLIETLTASGWQVTPSPDAPSTSEDYLASVSCASARSCVAVGDDSGSPGGADHPLIETMASGSWKLTPSSSEVGGASLDGVSCPSATSCVAVGSYVEGTTSQALVETMVGGSWEVTPSPDRGSGSNQLSGVSCPSPVSCVAVGWYQAEVGAARQTLIETLTNGSLAALGSSPNRSAGDNELNAVSCSSAASCVAAGDYNGGGQVRVLVASLADGAWSATTSSPDYGTEANDLLAVSCPSASSCVAAGHYDSGPTVLGLIETMTAGTWTLTSPYVFVPHAQLNGVSCVTSGTCVAVGDYYGAKGNLLTLVETPASGSWAVVPSPNSSSSENHLEGISCPAAGSCVAVGYYWKAGAGYRTLIEVLLGGSWRAIPSPNAGSSSMLEGVSCTGPRTCTAVGEYTGSAGTGTERTLVETEVNGAWAVVASPELGSADDALQGVSCAAPGWCVAVGYGVTGNIDRTLAETLANGTWTVTATQNPATAGDNTLAGVSCVTEGLCVAVGSYSEGGHVRSLVEMLANGSWSVASSPDPVPLVDDVLTGVSCPAPTSCEAVGWQEAQGGSSTTQPLIVALGNGSWQAALSQGPSASYDYYLAGVSCPPSGNCVAVGRWDDGSAQMALVEAGTAPAPVSLPTTTSLSSSLNPSVAAETVTYAALVTARILAPSAGTVTFTDDGVGVAGCIDLAMSPATLQGMAAASATCSAYYNSSQAGDHLIQASYTGSAGFNPSSSALLGQVVGPMPLGYWLATRSGAVFGVGAALSMGGVQTPPPTPLVGIAASPDGKGYWLATANGSVAAFGDAAFHGDLPTLGVSASDVVAIAPTADGRGYWLVARDGGLFAFGDAGFHGSLPGAGARTEDIVGMAATPGGRGYLLVGSDGGVFTFGDSRFHGSLPSLGVGTSGVRAILLSGDGRGYILVASDGGVFVFGSGVGYYGSLSAEHIKVHDIVGIALTLDDRGYYMAGAGGEVYGFGDAKALPSPAGDSSKLPVVGIAGT
ncbi:MAG TPA: Ig-like domain-containing protein [Acidimicrobiales bacterium]|nr:Ig-like domain-containing protein [Acidimicrobiales bacterium]